MRKLRGREKIGMEGGSREKGKKGEARVVAENQGKSRIAEEKKEKKEKEEAKEYDTEKKNRRLR